MKRPRAVARGFAWGTGVLLVCVVTLWWLSGRMDGPWGMIPGGPFQSSGPDLPCAELRAIASDALTEIEVELGPQAPRSITTWNVVLDGSLYFPADFLTPFKRWPHQVLADSRIRLRAGGRVFQCEALRVNAPERIAALRQTIAAKYEIKPDSWASRTEVWWFEAVPVAGSDPPHSRISPRSIPSR